MNYKDEGNEKYNSEAKKVLTKKLKRKSKLKQKEQTLEPTKKKKQLF